jgi:RecJ-like exonuclease
VNPICHYCASSIPVGDGVFAGTGFFMGRDAPLFAHRACYNVEAEKRAKAELEARLPYVCPACEGEGKAHQGHTEMKWVALSEEERTLCGYGDCRGCERCKTGGETRDVPIKTTCALCKGAGRLATKPKPITKIIGWDL